ncbi:SAM-dependent methyltransferase [Amycolatopsis sp. H20-H5]|uniref:SAM-dependent methyltransferase n=1 Tax=Amycolatopsis sp. H20-H5 TaxID=3046309 RepID=UPI002DB6C515|nr:SAM-dependent methyltransferase [Amycolatopsis sp. H20-H5]MEC3979202.1 SAM-dependent methyltransferase [Amycolatopsis sp. H20-H5]
MTSSVPAPAGNHVGLPNIARIRDYWLGGSNHTEADSGLADQIALCAPHLPYLVRVQRALIRRLVGFAVERGVRQFLDLGSGVPMGGTAHEVARELDPACRVVYVDADPGIVSEGRALLGTASDVAIIQADIRDPAQVFDAPELSGLLDLGQPIAVLVIETLLHIPDSDSPAAMVAAYVDRVATGSYLAISHFGHSEELSNGLGVFEQMFGSPPPVTLRDSHELERFFAGMEKVVPGTVPVPLWRPADDDEVARNPERAQVYVGVARKV